MKNKINLKCRLGWHNWSKWESVELVVSSPLLEVFTKKSSSEVVLGQERVCLNCNKEELRNP